MKLLKYLADIFIPSFLHLFISLRFIYAKAKSLCPLCSLLMSFTKTPFLGRKNGCKATGRGFWVMLEGETTYICKSVIIATLIWTNANLLATHVRGPLPNGSQEYTCLFLRCWSENLESKEEKYFKIFVNVMKSLRAKIILILISSKNF